MADKQFKDIGLDHAKAAAALIDAGAIDLTEVVLKGGKLVQHGGSYEGKRFLIQLFVKGNGKCTIGNSTKFDVGTFEAMAAAIKRRCSVGSPSPLNARIPRFTAEHAEFVLDFLCDQGAEISSDEVTPDYRIIRVAGPRGDQLTFKHFSNGTFQMQGVHAQVAGWALDAVQTRLPLDEILAHQKDVYSVPLSVSQMEQNLEVRVPLVHDYLRERIRIQLSSSLALTQVGIALEDHSAIAFNALRGLEGYCFQLLTDEVGANIGAKASLGDYFDWDAPTLRIRDMYRGTCSDQVQQALVECYQLWHNRRHRLFHMDGDIDTTVVLEAREQAVAIVDEVLNMIEVNHTRIRRSKGKACESSSS